MSKNLLFWLGRFSAMPDMDLVRQSICVDKNALAAIAFALWGMHVESKFCLRNWWVKRYLEIYPRWDEYSRRRNSRFEISSQGISDSERRWLAANVYQSELWASFQGAWAMAKRLAYSDDEGNTQLVLDVLGTNWRIFWTACRRPDGDLEFFATQPCGFDADLIDKNPTKQERCDAWNAAEVVRRKKFLGTLPREVLLRNPTEGWSVAKGFLPPLDLAKQWCEKHVVQVADNSYRAIVFECDSVCVARTLDIPIEVRVPLGDPVAAIHELESAAAQYVRLFQKKNIDRIVTS